MFRFRRILCPIDFFPPSTRAFECARGLAAKYQAEIHVVHAIPPVITAAYGATISAADIVSDLKRDSKRKLQELAAENDAAHISVTTEVRVGDIDSQIRRAIKSRRPDLVIMGTHGRRGFERWIIGSVTERMIRHCPVPLLVVGPRGTRAAASFDFKRILVATDLSDGTASALSHALSIAREHRSAVTLLHVVNDVAADVSGKYREPLLQGVEDKLHALVPKQGRSYHQVDVEVATGSPVRVIPRILKDGKYDLLIMNIHGKSLVERALIGSTAERVVRATSGSCPILLIPPTGSRHGRTKKS